MADMTMKKFIDKADISRQTAYDWMERGFIKRKYFGTKPKFSDEDLADVPNIKKMLKQNQHRL